MAGLEEICLKDENYKILEQMFICTTRTVSASTKFKTVPFGDIFSLFLRED